MNDVWVVAGGANGIGSAIASELSKENKVIVLDKSEPSDFLDNVQYLEVDLTKEAEVVNAIKHLDLDTEVCGLVLSVGVMSRGTIFDSTEDEYDLLMDTNVKSIWLLLKHINPKLKRDALVLQISSGHVLDPEPDPGIYTLSKKSVTSLAEMLALTCPELDIRTVYPGPVITNLLLTGRSKKEAERLKKISIQPSELATKVMKLLDSNKKVLRFDPKPWDYVIE